MLNPLILKGTTFTGAMNVMGTRDKRDFPPLRCHGYPPTICESFSTALTVLVP
jgi:hypothetical protein